VCSCSEIEESPPCNKSSSDYGATYLIRIDTERYGVATEGLPVVSFPHSFKILRAVSLVDVLSRFDLTTGTILPILVLLAVVVFHHIRHGFASFSVLSGPEPRQPFTKGGKHFKGGDFRISINNKDPTILRTVVEIIFPEQFCVENFDMV
jgi:hypothetical protein